MTALVLDDQDYSDRKIDGIYVFDDFFDSDPKLATWAVQFKEMVGTDLDETTFDRLLNVMVQESLRANLTGETGSDAANAIIFTIGEWLSGVGADGIASDFDPAADAKLEQHMYNMLMRLMELIHRTVSTRIHIGEDSVGIIAEVPEQVHVSRENGDSIIATVMMKTIDLGLPVDPTWDQFEDLMKDFMTEAGQYVGKAANCTEGEYVYIGRNKQPNGTHSVWGNPHFIQAKDKNDLNARRAACMEFYKDVIEGLTDRGCEFHWRHIADLHKKSLCCHCSDFTNIPDPTKFCHGHVLAAIAMRIVAGAQEAGLPTAA